MTPFPTLKLPFLALQRVIQVANPADVFHFSLCSSKCRQVVRIVKPKIQKISWYLDVHSNMILLGKCPNSANSPQFRINIFQRRISEGADSRSRAVTNYRRIDDGRAVRRTYGFENSSKSAVFLRETDDKVHIDFEVAGTEARENLLKDLINYLKDLFSCQLYHLGYFSDPLDPDLLSLLLPIKMLNFITYPEQYEKIFELLRLEGGQIDSFRVDEDNFYPLPNEFTFNEIPSSKNIDIPHAPWLSFRNISTMEFVNLKVGNPNLSNSDVNRLLQLWNSGGYDHLESICFRTKERQGWNRHAIWNMAQVLEGLNVVKKRHEKMRIIQRSDGLKAQIFCDQELFRFVVLHPGTSTKKFTFLTMWHTMGLEENFSNYLNAV